MSVRRDALVGLVLVGAVVLAIVGTLWLQGVMVRGDFREVEAVFSEVGLIRAGNAVKLRGVGIGRVRTISVDPTGSGSGWRSGSVPTSFFPRMRW
jgi:phospholipid/cholesterol/gamma-HCH transport system substrate-binding protein